MSRASVAVVESLYAAFARRDLAEVFGTLDANVHIRQSTELPWGGTYEGHDGARQFFGKLAGAISSTLVLDRLIDAGDHVVAIGRTTGTVNATGRRFDVPISHVWEVREGKVTAAQFCIDNPTMLAALSG
jgi:ketosteroid isomerase-like protein